MWLTLCFSPSVKGCRCSRSSYVPSGTIDSYCTIVASLLAIAGSQSYLMKHWKTFKKKWMEILQEVWSWHKKKTEEQNAKTIQSSRYILEILSMSHDSAGDFEETQKVVSSGSDAGHLQERLCEWHRCPGGSAVLCWWILMIPMILVCWCQFFSEVSTREPAFFLTINTPVSVLSEALYEISHEPLLARLDDPSNLLGSYWSMKLPLYYFVLPSRRTHQLGRWIRINPSDSTTVDVHFTRGAWSVSNLRVCIHIYNCIDTVHISIQAALLGFHFNWRFE